MIDQFAIILQLTYLTYALKYILTPSIILFKLHHWTDYNLGGKEETKLVVFHLIELYPLQL